MDWLNAGCCLLDLANNWWLVLIISLTVAGGWGGWSLGVRLDANWGTEFMAPLLAVLGAVCGFVISLLLLSRGQFRSDREP
ncbi:hypothetical protein IT575_07025 [bacterium]|nr:hypothetical protein [bacterium]